MGPVKLLPRKWQSCNSQIVGALGAAALALAAASVANADSYPHMHYNEVRQKMAHNAMDAWEPVLDMMLYHRIRALEFDIHNTKEHSQLNGDWWVYHWFGSEHHEHTAETLSDALEEVKTFHRHNPQHEVVTFYIDMHDPFEEANQQPRHLDALIKRFFVFDDNLDKSEIFAPTHLFHSGDPKFHAIAGAGPCGAGTLQGVVDGDLPVKTHPACRWPLLSELRGKIIFVLTGGNSQADQYVGFHGKGDAGAKSSDSDWLNRVAFVTYDHAAVTSAHFDAKTNPLGFDRRPWELFFNETKNDAAALVTSCPKSPSDCTKPMQRIILDKHLIGRSFDSDSADDWTQQRKVRVQLIATDMMNYLESPFTVTHSKTGFPFQCGLTPGEECGEALEFTGHPMFWFKVVTDDMNNNGDDDSIAFAERLDASDTTYSLQVLSPQSHVEDWAKACVMARSDRGAKAAYFAVCRVADNHRIQVQWRSADGADAKAAGYDDNIDMDGRLAAIVHTVSTGGYHDNGISADSGPTFIRFESSNNSQDFTASASRDGVNWHQIFGPRHFSKPLSHKGISATAHGDDTVLWRFAEFQVGNSWKDGSDSEWNHWLIGDGGHPKSPPSPDGNARSYSMGSGWGD
jgi:hypothetical protein